MIATCYKNENIHLKFNQEFMKKLNVEAARLNKWIKTPFEASDEIGIKIKDCEKFFKSNFCLTSNVNKLLNYYQINTDSNLILIGLTGK